VPGRGERGACIHESSSATFFPKLPFSPAFQPGLSEMGALKSWMDGGAGGCVCSGRTMGILDMDMEVEGVPQEILDEIEGVSEAL
jgi:hypothetical protein